jgi:DNA-binding transcriptional ArsR family regulator
MITFMLDSLLNWLRLPGDALADWLTTDWPSVAGLIGLAEPGRHATIVLSVSALTWLTAIIVVSIAFNAVRDADRAMTAYVASRYADARRLLRILRRRITSSLGQWRQRQQEPDFAVAAVELEQMEARVLRCYAGAGELRAVAPDEVASRLGLSERVVERVLRALQEHHLVERAFGRDEGKEAHRITRAGQIYLLEQ